MFNKINATRSKKAKTPLRKFGKKNINQLNQTVDSNISFEEILQKEKKQFLNDKIVELIAEFDEVSSTLTSESNLDNFIRYKNLIKRLLHQLIPNSQQVNQNSYRSPVTMNEYIYKTTQIIDKELDEMLQTIRKEQHDKIKITQKVISIRGLLLDIVIKH